MHLSGRATLSSPAAFSSFHFLWIPVVPGLDDRRRRLPLCIWVAGALWVLQRSGCAGNPRRHRPADRPCRILRAQTTPRPGYRGPEAGRHGSRVPRAAVPDKPDRIAVAGAPRNRRDGTAAPNSPGCGSGLVVNVALREVRAQHLPPGVSRAFGAGSHARSALTLLSNPSARPATAIR